MLNFTILNSISMILKEALLSQSLDKSIQIVQKATKALMTFTPLMRAVHFMVFPCCSSGQTLAPHWKISAAREKRPLETSQTWGKVLNQVMPYRWHVWFWGVLNSPCGHGFEAVNTQSIKTLPHSQKTGPSSPVAGTEKAREKARCPRSGRTQMSCTALS